MIKLTAKTAPPVSTLACGSIGGDWEVASSPGKSTNPVPLRDKWKLSPVRLNSHLSIAIDSIFRGLTKTD